MSNKVTKEDLEEVLYHALVQMKEQAKEGKLSTASFAEIRKLMDDHDVKLFTEDSPKFTGLLGDIESDELTLN